MIARRTGIAVMVLLATVVGCCKPSVSESHLSLDDVYELWINLSNRSEARGPASLSEPETAVLAVLTFEAEVNNGGFDQFFLNSSGALAHEALAGLHEVGLRSYASLLERAIALFPKNRVPKDESERDATVFAFPESSENVLEALDREFFALGGSLGEEVAAFARQAGLL